MIPYEVTEKINCKEYQIEGFYKDIESQVENIRKKIFK